MICCLWNQTVFRDVAKFIMKSRLIFFSLWTQKRETYVTRTLSRPEAADRHITLENVTWPSKGVISHVTENFKFRCFQSETLNYLKFQFSSRGELQFMNTNNVLIWCLHIAACRRSSYYSLPIYEISCYNLVINFWSKVVFGRSLIMDNTGHTDCSSFQIIINMLYEDSEELNKTWAWWVGTKYR
jgi:hypothetical protein